MPVVFCPAEYPRKMLPIVVELPTKSFALSPANVPIAMPLTILAVVSLPIAMLFKLLA